jgi:flagellar biosynthesis GTPase FlhF
MISAENIQPVNKLVKSQEKMAKLKIKIGSLRDQLLEELKKYNKEKEKYESMKEKQLLKERRRETKKAEKEAQKTAKKAARLEEREAIREARREAIREARREATKAARNTKTSAEKEAIKAEKSKKSSLFQAKREIRHYWSTAEQVEMMAELDTDSLIRMGNSSDPETGISLENLYRIHGHCLQSEYPDGWKISTFISTFRFRFSSLNCLQKEIKYQEKTISSAFYRMCPESETSTNKITGKLRAIPSFMKIKGEKAKYIFDANLYLK